MARFNHEALERARLELGLTQEQAARSLGIDVRTYRRYASGDVNASGKLDLRRASRRKIVEKIKREFGIDEAELLGANEPPGEREEMDRRTGVGHALPRARHFVGRAALVERLSRWAAAPRAELAVVALVAMGGAGKTSLVERALRGAPRVFSWSFYDDPRVEAFLGVLGSFVDGRGDLVERAASSLESGSLCTLALDGLEVIQASGATGRARGELDDPRMRLFLRRIASVRGAGRALVTSRLELVDLDGFAGTSVETIHLGPLDDVDARALMRSFGVKANDRRLSQAAKGVGHHALSVAMMGSYAAAFLGGDLDAVAGVALTDAARDEPLARRLEGLLDAYAAALSDVDRDVLARLSIFERGANVAALERIARAGGQLAGALANARRAAIVATVARLTKLGLVVEADDGRLSVHPILRRHFGAFVADHRAAVHAIERDAAATRLGPLDERPEALPRTKAMLDALEALFEHTLGAGDVERAASLLQRAMGGYAHLGLVLGENARGLRMSRAFAVDAFAIPTGDPADLDTRLSLSMRRRLAYDWGLYEGALGDFRAAVRAYEASNALGREMNDDVAELTGQRALAYTHRLLGSFDVARAHVDASIEIARRVGASGELARSIALRGAIATSRRDFDAALEAFAVCRALGDVPVARRGIWEAECLFERGLLDEARAMLEANLRVCARLGWEGHEAHCRAFLGRIAVRVGDRAVAAAHLGALGAWCDRSGDVETSLCRAILGVELARFDRDRESHERELRAGLELAEVSGARAIAATLRALVSP